MTESELPVISDRQPAPGSAAPCPNASLPQHRAITHSKFKRGIYCDPPYIDRHADYFNGWNGECENKLAELLSFAPCKFILSTWHSNESRKNTYIDTLWSEFSILTQEHYYHVGARETNRNPMTEALVTNYQTVFYEGRKEKTEQMRLLDSARQLPQGKPVPSRGRRGCTSDP